MLIYRYVYTCPRTCAFVMRYSVNETIMSEMFHDLFSHTWHSCLVIWVRKSCLSLPVLTGLPSLCWLPSGKVAFPTLGWQQVLWKSLCAWGQKPCCCQGHRPSLRKKWGLKSPWPGWGHPRDARSHQMPCGPVLSMWGPQGRRLGVQRSWPPGGKGRNWEVVSVEHPFCLPWFVADSHRWGPYHPGPGCERLAPQQAVPCGKLALSQSPSQQPFHISACSALPHFLLCQPVDLQLKCIISINIPGGGITSSSLREPVAHKDGASFWGGRGSRAAQGAGREVQDSLTGQLSVSRTHQWSRVLLNVFVLFCRKYEGSRSWCFCPIHRYVWSAGEHSRQHTLRAPTVSQQGWYINRSTLK